MDLTSSRPPERSDGAPSPPGNAPVEVRDVPAGGANESAPLEMPSDPAPRVLSPSVSPAGRSLSTTAGSGSVDGARFAPGTLFGGRYRIGGFIGRGGMGEVYRGEDLVLGQTVALKFLPDRFARDPARNERFFAEVRLARQVSHPNVCRVYDIGEANGHTFLSMEFVEGDDLRTLLRRVGRLPQDRAVRIAQQLCAGLDAAHRAGILHRDLKPGNVIIDREGNARILDFGLAAVDGRVGEDDVRAGTPAYMAPEQLAGKAVTPRSDVFALGLVLYELFTGHPAFEGDGVEELQRAHATQRPTPPGDLVEGLSPRVDRAILRCLMADPEDRPGSARAVAAALPGADPLAAALAAGQTPSPQMVAESGSEGGLSKRTAAIGVGLVLAMLLGVLFLNARFGLISPVPLEKSATELAYDARRILDTLGHTEPGLDEAFGFDLYEEYLAEIRRSDQSRQRWDRLARPRPAAVDFWYRRAPVVLMPPGLGGRVSLDEPAAPLPGAIKLRLSPDGHLRELIVHTGWVEARETSETSERSEPSEADVRALLNAAGLDVSGLERAEPERLPPVYASSRLAWSGVYPEAPDIGIRVETGWVGARATWLRIAEDRWPQASAPAVDPRAGALRAHPEINFGDAVTGIVSAVCIVLALVSLRNRRGDREGAFKLGMTAFGVVLAAELLTVQHLVTLSGAVRGLVQAGAAALLAGIFVWLLYIALEPIVRRQWPETLIAWSRLLAGRWRDPLVGQTTLIGMATGLLCAALALVEPWLNPLIGKPPGTPFEGTLMTIPALLGERHALGGVLMDGIFRAIVFAVILLATLVVIRLIVRNRVAAMVIFGVIQTGAWVAPAQEPNVLTWLVYALVASVTLVVMVRYGLLAVIAGTFAFHLAVGLPATSDLASWQFGLTAIAFLLPAAFAVFAGLVAVQPGGAGRRLGLLTAPSA
ncbi:MAG: serine/threonine protein kinase [Phycisphaerales bacterium]|nr:MAG: serine/threonine protein kinase [Phycisphaerales bacterium]